MMQHHNSLYVDYNFFNDIDTEEKAYFLGLLMADGCVTKDSYVRLSLTDKEIIIKYKNALKSEHKLLSHRLDSGKYLWSIVIKSEQLTNALLEYGVVPNKSLKQSPIPKLRKNLMPHYIRGLFDGDGCIYKSEKGSPLFYICSGNKKMLKDIQNVMIQCISLNKTKFYSHRNIYYMRYSGGSQIEKIYNWLYKDATIYLERKKLKFEEIIKIKNISEEMINSGRHNNNSKVNEEQVKYIKSSNLSKKELMKKFNLSRTQIYRIQSGKRWKYVSD